MSWSRTNPVAIAKSEVAALHAEVHQSQPEGCLVAARDQEQAAAFAAAILAHSVGRPTDDVVVTMSGHANPDHAPTPGWADEFVTITVTAKPSA